MLVNDLANRPARPARSRVLRLRGLPYRAVEDDIILFLAPLPVIKVHICRRSGESGIAGLSGVLWRTAVIIDLFQAEQLARHTSSFIQSMKPGRLLGQRIDSTWAIDTSSEYYRR